MDFGSLLHIAKKNSESSLEDRKYYSTKYDPPKKQSKEKKLSDNIKKFLEKREQEEKERKREHQEKVAKLLAMRNESSKSKIRKMLKTTKSANKSLLPDATDNEHTAITLLGGEQPDQDDYGYVSNEANAFYQRYIDMVKDVKEDKGFAPIRPQSVKDLTGTKERVKAALNREVVEKQTGSRQRHSKEISSSNPSSSNSVTTRPNCSKPLYDPESERQEELRKKEEQRKQKRKVPPPPPIDFQSLLKLAEKKQFEPIKLEIKKKEPERLLTLKEKREIEERKKAKEIKLHRKTDDLPAANDKKSKPTESIAKIPNNSGNPSNLKQTSKLPTNASSSKLPANVAGNVMNTYQKSDIQKLKTVAQPTSTANSHKTMKADIPSSNKSSTSSTLKSSTLNKKADTKPSENSNNRSNGHSNRPININSSNNQSAINKSSKESIRDFPPRHNTNVTNKLTKPNTSTNSQNTRQFPPPDVRSSLSNRNAYSNNSRKSNGTASRKRILDDDDDEYDSEMDDFIDDGDENEDYSAHIKAIFGYDKSRYRDDYDDAAMESSFAQVQREEYISKKIGIQEDLEDMKMEAMEKKRKMMKLKKPKLDK